MDLVCMDGYLFRIFLGSKMLGGGFECLGDYEGHIKFGYLEYGERGMNMCVGD